MRRRNDTTEADRKGGDIDAAVGARLREIRESRRMNQRDFGKLLDLSQATVSRLEIGDQIWTLAMLAKIAGKLGIPTSELQVSMTSAA